MLRVGHSPGKGRGVFALKDYKKGEIIECSPVIIIPQNQVMYIGKTILSSYWFNWGENKECAIALGYGSLFNHSYQPKVVYFSRVQDMCIEFQAIEDIQIGQEITINYKGNPNDKSPVWFKVVD